MPNIVCEPNERSRHLVGRRSLLLRLVGSVAVVSLAACAPSAASPTTAPTAPPPPPAAPKPTAATSAPTEAAKPAAAAPTVVTPQAATVGVIKGPLDAQIVPYAKERGIFDKWSIDATVSEASAGTTLVQGVVSGQINACVAVGTLSILSAIAEDAPLKILGTSNPGLTYIVYGRSDRGLAAGDVMGLSGKTIAASQPGALLHTMTIALLTKHNIDPEKVQIVNIGSSADTYRAVAAGKTDAGMSTYEYLPLLPEEPGVIVVADLAKELPRFHRASIFGSQRDLTGAPKMLEGVLGALAEAMRVAYLEQPDDHAKFVAERTGLEPGNVMQSIQYLKDNKLISTDLLFDPADLAPIQKLNLDLKLQKKEVPVEAFVEFGPLRAALQRLASR